MLREWGVEGVQVNEVVPLETVLDGTPTSTYGLVFLSRYTSSSSDKTEKEDVGIPNGLWFANQVCESLFRHLSCVFLIIY
jgi:Ubiquitin carboxyl-terminal hydrolase, family 1